VVRQKASVDEVNLLYPVFPNEKLSGQRGEAVVGQVERLVLPK